ncbi:MAG: helix-turn-helix domain-containing protein [Clostridia bacterium]|nr:helix-turn-helix domain-containing protein [Clostridia bacterium]
MENYFRVSYHQYGRKNFDQTRHRHEDCYELVQTWVDGGTVLINDRLYPICRGSVYLINAMNIHSTNPPCPNEYERSVLTIDRSYADALFKVLGLSDYMDQVLIANSGGFFRLDARTAELVDSEYKTLYSVDPTCEREKTVFVRAISTILPLIINRGAADEANNTSISRVLNYINSHISESLSINSISEATNISKFYLCRAFRKATGITVMTYICEQRLAIAKELLLETKESILKVALTSGFINSSYFSQLFRAREGMTPSEYRRRYSK